MHRHFFITKMKLLLVLLLLITTVQARRLFQRSLLLKGNLESETFDFPPVDSSRYNLVIDTTDVDPTFRPAFDAAASRWQQVIVQDLPNIDSATLLHSWCPRLPDVVDDVVACAFTLHMDGPGRVLGRAGVEYRRSSTGLTITGLLEFDAADADLPEFGTVVLHELGHVVRVVQDIFFFHVSYFCYSWVSISAPLATAVWLPSNLPLKPRGKTCQAVLPHPWNKTLGRVRHVRIGTKLVCKMNS